MDDNVQASRNLLHNVLEWLEEFTENLEEKKKCQHGKTHPQTLLRIQIRNVQRQWCRVNTVVTLTSRRTEVATSARGTKPTRASLEEHALAQPYLEQKMLVTWLQQITNFLVKGWWVSKQSPIRCRGSRSWSLRKFLEPSQKPVCCWLSQLLCTCWARKIWGRQKWIRWGDPGPPLRWWLQMEQSKQPRKHKYMFAI